MVRGGNGGLLRGNQWRQGRRAGGSRPQGGSGWQGAALGGAGGSRTPVGKGRLAVGQRPVDAGGCSAASRLVRCRWRIAGAGRRRQARVAAHGASARPAAGAAVARAAATRTPEVEGGVSTATAPQIL